MVAGSGSQPRLIDDLPGTEALSIADLYRRIDRAVQRALPGQMWITGEIRSMDVSSGGHCYLDLVDPSDLRNRESPVLKSVCFASRWRAVRMSLERLGIPLDVGMVVRVRGQVELYKPRGSISFVISEIDTEALLGKVAAARARLVKTLVDEGLFERNRRLPIPVVPLRIGLVASPGTEGHRDFLGQLESSGMAFRVVTAPTQVQGRGAPASVAGSIKRLQSSRCDLLVVVRGGGSKADLATFDTEVVARAIATSAVPVWAGIGHTGDLSVADEVANRSFITPTECGQELSRIVTGFWRDRSGAGLSAARLGRELLERAEVSLARRHRSVANGARNQIDRHGDRLTHLARNLRGAARGQLERHAHHLLSVTSRAVRCSRQQVGAEERNLVTRSTRLATLPGRRLEVAQLRNSQWRRLFAAYDYHRQLERGYSVTRDGSGAIVRSIDGLTVGETLETQLADGSVGSSVVSVDREKPRTSDADDDGGSQ